MIIHHKVRIYRLWIRWCDSMSSVIFLKTTELDYYNIKRSMHELCLFQDYENSEGFI
jgi:hypothetical protein